MLATWTLAANSLGSFSRPANPLDLTEKDTRKATSQTYSTNNVWAPPPQSFLPRGITRLHTSFLALLACTLLGNRRFAPRCALGQSGPNPPDLPRRAAQGRREFAPRPIDGCTPPAQASTHRVDEKLKHCARARLEGWTHSSARALWCFAARTAPLRSTSDILSRSKQRGHTKSKKTKLFEP